MFSSFSHTSTFQLPDKPWSQVLSPLPPGSCLQFLSRIGFSNPTARRFFIECEDIGRRLHLELRRIRGKNYGMCVLHTGVHQEYRRATAVLPDALYTTTAAVVAVLLLSL